MSESFGDVDQNELKIREDKDSIEWEDDDDEVCLKRMKVSEEKPVKKRLEKSVATSTNNTSTNGVTSDGTHNLSMRIPIEKTVTAINDVTLLQESMTSEELRKCKELNRKLMNQPESPAFNTPVDPVALQVPTYFSVIKRPMDLGTIKHNLSDKKYITKEEFQADMLLVFDNALLFNHPDSEVYHWAVKLKKQFETLWKNAFKEKKTGDTKTSTTSHNDTLNKVEEKKSEVSNSKKTRASSRKKNTNKPLTKEEMIKLRSDLKQIEKNKDKLIEVLAVVNVDSKGKNEVSLDLSKYTTQQLRELQRILKGKGRKDGDYDGKTYEEKMQQSIQELELLKKIQGEPIKKSVVNKPKKDEESDSDNELSSSSSLDSEEANLMRMTDAHSKKM
ncbi:bromodomain-containing factor, putative [Entamoeba dispar SAW760]|uniref:Bromodomain-containing factor, putative n=1 Tax=Entamoeba dispar (strain ATCC PRA-260 / SAW760) TaxID=370354 RepID=B0EB35_ENTDS|nr:bromodomain-containing factor, putative [Entamoeba dispar SAW760]EDR28252.1 bromodomain-containing factor, putative [Entamoeba dispar SAW760]|eukprot:EDR28252.1 bromodomain-containing factor, putative [Entamoeba dispar SAW760]